MSLTHLGAAEFLNAIMGGDGITVTSTLELALFTQAASGSGSTPDDNPDSGTDGTDANEIDPGGGYSRQSITFGTASAGSTASIVSSNGQSYTTATADWGSGAHAAAAWIGGWCIYDTSTTPIPLWVGAFNTAKQVQNNDTVSITSGDLTLQLA